MADELAARRTRDLDATMVKAARELLGDYMADALQAGIDAERAGASPEEAQVAATEVIERHHLIERVRTTSVGDQDARLMLGSLADAARLAIAAGDALDEAARHARAREDTATWVQSLRELADGVRLVADTATAIGNTVADVFTVERGRAS